MKNSRLLRFPYQWLWQVLNETFGLIGALLIQKVELGNSHGFQLPFKEQSKRRVALLYIWNTEFINIEYN